MFNKRFGWLVVMLTVSSTVRAVTGDAVPVVFDTDICGDCDDVLAMAMLHSLESRGACKIVAVTVSVRNDLAAPFVDAVNTFYGRGRIPVGTVGPGGVVEQSAFLSLAVEKDGPNLRYPRTLGADLGAPVPDATAVLRKALAAQPDGSAVVIQVGFSTNLARLLESPADADSPMTGLELVRKKVKLLSLMAGSFTPIRGDSRYLEYNVKRDVASARAVAAGWPTDVVWSGFEIGEALPFPHQSIERDFAYTLHHPAAEAYVLRNPPPHDRPTWDLTSVLFGVYPDRDYFDLSPPGRVTVEADGFTRFDPDPKGRHRYLILQGGQRGRATEAMVQLSSEPPAIRGGTSK